MIYLDNDYETFQGGPINCAAGGLGNISAADGVPCFDGGDHVITGGVGPGPNGSATVEFEMDFPFVLGGSANTPLPFSFTLFATGGGATLIGNSNIPLGGSKPGRDERQPNVYCLRSRYRMRTEFTVCAARTGAELHRTAAINQRIVEPGSDGRWRSAVYR